MPLDIKNIQKISSTVRQSLFRKANAISSGLFKTQFRGSGLQFREHQVYEPGDDVRFIDWKMSAKMRRTYIKTFEEERNVEIDVVIDLTPSMMMGYKNISKTQAAMEIAALLGLVAARTADKVKVILLCQKPVETEKASGQEIIVGIVSAMQKCQLFSANGSINRDAEIISVSNEQRINWLRRLASGKRQLLYISDFSEVDMPSMKTFLGRKNFYAIKLVTPLDWADKVPFSLLTQDRNGKSFNYRKNMRSQNEPEEEKMLLKLDISKNFLQNFIRVMRKKA